MASIFLPERRLAFMPEKRISFCNLSFIFPVCLLIAFRFLTARSFLCFYLLAAESFCEYFALSFWRYSLTHSFSFIKKDCFSYKAPVYFDMTPIIVASLPFAGVLNIVKLLLFAARHSLIFFLWYDSHSFKKNVLYIL